MNVDIIIILVFAVNSIKWFRGGSRWYTVYKRDNKTKYNRILFVISYQYLPNVTITICRVFIIVAVVYIFIVSPTHIYTAIRLYYYYTIEQETFLSVPISRDPTTVWKFEGLGGHYVISLFLFYFFFVTLMSTYDIFSLLYRPYVYRHRRPNTFPNGWNEIINHQNHKVSSLYLT